MKQMNLQNRKRLTDLEKELMVAGGRVGEGRIVREFGMDLYLQLLNNFLSLFSPGRQSSFDKRKCFFPALSQGRPF